MEELELYRNNIISVTASGREALQMLDLLSESESQTLFVVDGNKLAGTLTDGDIRRGLLKGKEISDSVSAYMERNFKSLHKTQIKPDVLAALRLKEIWLLPVLNSDGEIEQIIDLKSLRTVIPASVLILAGGRGERLKPLTDTVPKPMLKVGNKPIIEVNIDRLIQFGIKKFYISVRYLSQVIINHLGDGSSKNISIEYIHDDEDLPLGTLGACSQIKNIEHEQLLVMNADILTNIDFEDLYNYYKSSNALMCAASIPYKVQLPYGILQADENHIIEGLVEKPTYTYYANAGIYLLDCCLLKEVPKNTIYNATDLMQSLIDSNRVLVHYPILQYWLDIGKYDDYLRAQEDFKHIKF